MTANDGLEAQRIELRLSAHYVGPDVEGEMEVGQFAEALQGFGLLAKAAGSAKIWGAAPPPQVKAKPPEDGSFTVLVMLLWIWDNSGHLLDLTPVAAMIGGAIELLMKRLRCPVKSIDPVGDGDEWKIIYEDGSFLIVSRETLDLMQAPRLKKALRKIGGPVDGRAVRQVDLSVGEHHQLITDDDRRALEESLDQATPSTRTFDTTAKLSTVDFDMGGAWKFHSLEGDLRGMMVDEEFRAKIDSSEVRLGKNDELRIRVRVDSRVDSDGKISKHTNIERVLKYYPGGQQDELPTEQEG